MEKDREQEERHTKHQLDELKKDKATMREFLSIKDKTIKELQDKVKQATAQINDTTTKAEH